MKQHRYIHQGKRTNQEDAFNITENAFVVCDGVGGHTKGEVASNFVATNTIKAVNNNGINNAQEIQEILKNVQQELNHMLVENPEAEGMGTTFCGLFKTEQAFHTAHIGDSRLYYIKPKEQVLWHTWDHSLVSYLVQTNEITREDARFHPQNNRISRAIIAKESNKVAKADITTLTNIEKGDLFFLCSDGVNEAWTDLDLISLLMSNISIEKKLKTIKDTCAIASKDNNTAILLEIEEKDVLKGVPNAIKMLSLQDLINDQEKYNAKQLLVKNIAEEEEKEEKEDPQEEILANIPDDNARSKQALETSSTIESEVKPIKGKYKTILYGLILLLLIVFSVLVVKSWFAQKDTPGKEQNERKREVKTVDNSKDKKRDIKPVNSNNIKEDKNQTENKQNREVIKLTVPESKKNPTNISEPVKVVSNKAEPIKTTIEQQGGVNDHNLSLLKKDSLKKNKKQDIKPVLDTLNKNN